MQPRDADLLSSGGSHDVDPAELGQRLVVLRNLITLGQIRIKVVLRAKMDVWLMRQPSAIAASTAKSTAFRFRTGRAPGSPRQTGQTLVLGGSPKRVEHEQKILVAVKSWTCTSSPITGSNFERAATEVPGVVAIPRDYKGPPALNVVVGI